MPTEEVVVTNPAGEQPTGAGGSSTTQPKPDANGGGQQPVGAGAGGGDKTFSFKEDRTDWVPRHRLENTNALKTKISELEKQINETSGRIKTAFGVGEPTAQEQEREAIKKAITEMFPGLQSVGDLTREEIEEIRSAARAAQQTSAAHWERHATSMVGEAESEVAGAIGATELSPTQKKSLHRAYREAAVEAMNDRIRAVQAGSRRSVDTTNADTDFLARHERGDKGLIKEFTKAFLGDWFEPAKRQATTANAMRQRPVPRGERARTLPTSKTAEIDYNDPDAFKKAMLDARNQG